MCVCRAVMGVYYVYGYAATFAGTNITFDEPRGWIALHTERC